MAYQKIQPGSDGVSARTEGGTRKRYRKPLLERLGELRTLTLGGSPGVGDSGAGAFVELPPADISPGPFPPPGSIP